MIYMIGRIREDFPEEVFLYKTLSGIKTILQQVIRRDHRSPLFSSCCRQEDGGPEGLWNLLEITE